MAPSLSLYYQVGCMVPGVSLQPQSGSPERTAAEQAQGYG